MGSRRRPGRRAVLISLIDRRGRSLFFGIAIVATLAAALLLQSSSSRPPLLQAANKLGPAAGSLLHGRGLALCSGSRKHGGTETCAYSERMPLAPVSIAVLSLLFQSHETAAALCKTIVFLIPALLSFLLAWQHAEGRGRDARLCTLLIFTAALLLPATLDNAVNLNFEEAFYYSFLAFGVSVLLFPEHIRLHPRLLAFGAVLALALAYLTKSSMLLLATALILLLALWLLRSLRRPRLAAGVLLCFACVPLGWGVYQQQAGGRFTLGTSLDNFNLYKGNNAAILDHYPPPPGTSIDDFDGALYTAGRPTQEWVDSDASLAAALHTIRTQPAMTAHADLRKAGIFFLSLRRIGGDPHGRSLELAFAAGMLVFRVMLFAALVLACRLALTQRDDERFAAIAFLTAVVCVALPYIAGFALTRHATVLILPAAAYLCRVVPARQLL